MCPNRNQSPCSNGCFNLQTDVNNCGDCGTKCSAGFICSSGKWACPDRSLTTYNNCVNLLTEPNNLGNCCTKCNISGKSYDGSCNCTFITNRITRLYQPFSLGDTWGYSFATNAKCNFRFLSQVKFRWGWVLDSVTFVFSENGKTFRRNWGIGMSFHIDYQTHSFDYYI